jgi:hypothetical protein
MMTAIRTGMPEERPKDVEQIRRPREILQAVVVTHAQEAITAAVAVVATKKNSHEEDRKMSIVTSASPTSTAPAVRMCTSCKKTLLSYNNTTGVCTKCQRLAGGRVRNRSKNVNGHTAVRPFARGLQLARRAEVAEPAAVPEPKPNDGAGRDDRPRGNGNRAQPQPAEEHSRRSLGVARIEERVQLLLAAVSLDAVIAAIPRADQAKLVSAWLAGTL